MGTLDKIVGFVGDIVIDHAGEWLLERARKFVSDLLGDKGSDGMRERLARAALDATVAAAQHELAERKAADNLDDEARRVLGAIAAIDVAKLFAPAPHGHAGPAEVVIEEPNRDGPYRTLGEELAEAQAERAALEKEGK